MKINYAETRVDLEYNTRKITYSQDIFWALIDNFSYSEKFGWCVDLGKWVIIPLGKNDVWAKNTIRQLMQQNEWYYGHLIKPKRKMTEEAIELFKKDPIEKYTVITEDKDPLKYCRRL